MRWRARANRPDPSIALLTPGPRHNDFFSHAYLARYLGLLLVEGGDLRVVGRPRVAQDAGRPDADRPDRALHRRRSLADPLELDPSGFAGPVGLLQAVREQSGSGGQSAGLGAGREPRARSLPAGSSANEAAGRGPGAFRTGRRWWLGDAAARKQVLANLDRMVIRPAHESTARPGRAVAGSDPVRLGPTERAALLAGD